MAKFQFVGDVDELSDGQKDFISNVVQERGFENVNINIQVLGKVGDNFAANVKRVTVENDGETFKMIAKVAPRNEILRTVTNTSVVFQNEHLLYVDVLPKFTELEKAANIPVEERLRYAACYGTYMEPLNEIILLEDLEVPGFKMLDKNISLTNEHVRMVLNNLAILHSLSYALKYQEPETFKTFCNGLVSVWARVADNPEMIDWLDQLDDDVQLLFDDDKYKKAVKNVTARVAANALKLAEVDTTSKHSVIQQGDSWTNNLLFRFENDRAVECCMIDYQMSKQTSPVTDLHYMIFSSTDHATRKKHYHDWIDYYHSQLDRRLAKFGLDANRVYPRAQLEADLKMHAEFSLGQTVMGASLQIREKTDAAKLNDAVNSADKTIVELTDETKLSIAEPETIRKFKEKIEGVVNSFIEFGYL